MKSLFAAPCLLATLATFLVAQSAPALAAEGGSAAARATAATAAAGTTATTATTATAAVTAVTAAKSPPYSKDPWPRLAQKIERLDESTPGSLGVYLGRPDGGPALFQGGKHAFYLSSTTKVPVAIVLLKKVEAGEIDLQEELTLQESDYVDGAGDLQRTPPGAKFTIGALLGKMLVNSDSSATDMLIRRLTEKEIDQTLAAIEPGFGPITTILQVRYDAYSELHPRARELTNLDFIAFKKAGGPEARLQALAQRLGVQVRDLRLPSVDSAFEAYYRTGKNSAPLDAFGRLLAKLAAGQLLNPEHTKLMLKYMNEITTGSRRIQAGLPKGVRFAQKTGTQVGRLCNVGLLYPRSGTAPLAIAACLEKHPNQAEGERVFERVGELVGRSGLL